MNYNGNKPTETVEDAAKHAFLTLKRGDHIRGRVVSREDCYVKGFVDGASWRESHPVQKEGKTAEELIRDITVNEANLLHIAKTGIINGSLRSDILKAMEGYKHS